MPTVDPFTADLTAGKTIISAGSGDYVTTDAGIYELQAVFPGSISLFYTDAATKARDFACPDPACEHADESCPSYIPAPPEMYPPMLLRVGDQLLVVFTENFGDSVPHAILMNMDGSEKRTVFEFSNDQSIPGTFCTTGNDLFFVLRDFSAPGNTPDQLWYANFENDSLGKVMDLDDGDRRYSLCDDCPGSELCFCCAAPEGLSFCTYDAQARKMREPFYVDPGAAGNYVIRDGYLFTVNENENSVIRTRLADQEQKSVPFTVKESYRIQIMWSLFDGNLMVAQAQLDDANDTKDVYTCILDFDAGTCTEFTLEIPSGRGPVYAAAAIGDLYYVEADLTYYSIPVAVEDLVTCHEYAASKYAFMTRQDYYDSDPNGYQMVNDAFTSEEVQKALQEALDAVG